MDDSHPLGIAGSDLGFAIRNQQSMGHTSPPSHGRMARGSRRPRGTHQNIAHHLGIVLGAGWGLYVGDPRFHPSLCLERRGET